MLQHSEFMLNRREWSEGWETWFVTVWLVCVVRNVWTSLQYDMSSWRVSHRLLSRYPVFMINHCNTQTYWKRLDLFYRSLVFAVCGVHGSVAREHGWSCSVWFSRCDTTWVSRSSSKFHRAVMFALDLDQWRFAITGKVPQRDDGSVYDTGRLKMLKGTFLTPSRFTQ